jgi:hypothetical protein
MCSLKYLGLASCGTTQDDQFNIVSPRRLAARLSATARGSVPRQGVLSGANRYGVLGSIHTTAVRHRQEWSRGYRARFSHRVIDERTEAQTMTAADIAAIQSTLRAVSANASALSAVPRRSTSTARLRPGGMGEIDLRGALPHSNRVQRSEISALWDANRHGFLARELQSEGMLHPPEGRLPDMTLARYDMRPPLTPSGALIHEQLQRERAATAAANRPSTSSAAPVGRSTAGQRRPQSAFAVPWLPASDGTARQLERQGVRPSTSQPLLQQAPGLRISKPAARGGGGMPLPPSVPSNRSEAVRL